MLQGNTLTALLPDQRQKIPLGSWEAGYSERQVVLLMLCRLRLRGGVSCEVEWLCWRVWVNHAKVISTLQDWKGQWGGSSARRCRQNGTAWWSSIRPPAFGGGSNKTKDFPTGSLPLAYPFKDRSGCCPRSVQDQLVKRWRFCCWLGAQGSLCLLPAMQRQLWLPCAHHWQPLLPEHLSMSTSALQRYPGA